jgi:thiol-disulfide isomerase/thioredoxin
MGLARALLALLAAAAPFAAGQALYGAASPIAKLDKKGFAAMQADLERVWVVEFYADWCGHCKQVRLAALPTHCALRLRPACPSLSLACPSLLSLTALCLPTTIGSGGRTRPARPL